MVGGWQQADRHRTGEVAESYIVIQRQKEEREREEGGRKGGREADRRTVHWGFETSKLTSRSIPCPTRPQLSQ